MRLFSFAVLAVTLFSAINSATAQYYNSGTDPMVAMDNIMAELNQRQRNLERNMMNLNRKIVSDYRRKTNDYTTPDQIVLQRSMQAARRQNPAAFQALDRQHQTRMNNLNNQFQAGQAAHRMRQQASDASMNAYWQRSAASDRMQRRTVNNIWEQSDYINPSSGQITTLGWNNVNQFHTNGSSDFYTDQNHRQYQHDGAGTWQMLDEIDW